MVLMATEGSYLTKQDANFEKLELLSNEDSWYESSAYKILRVGRSGRPLTENTNKKWNKMAPG
jgi:hypothetical protein